ncbi:MAG: DUF3459 domain-containing protein, partial [Cyanobacteria bacterium J06627_15]
AESAWDRSLLEHHQQLIQLRHHHIALRTGLYQFLAAAGEGYAFARSHPKETVIVAVNAGDADTVLPIDAATIAQMPTRILFGIGQFETVNGGVQVTIPARSGVIWT